MRNKDLDYEHLGRYAFRCTGKTCDPFRVADADLAKFYFRGTLEGKKAMSIVILRLVFEAEQQGELRYMEPLKNLYNQVWEMKDQPEQRYTTSEGLRIMDEIAHVAEAVIKGGTAYN